MICSKCTLSNPLSLCAGTYLLGTADPETDYRIRIRNMVTGRIDYLSTTTDVNGELRITYTPMRHRYEIFVYTIDGILTPITISGNTAECIVVNFEVSHETEIKTE